MESVWGPSFPLGGLGGLPFTGKTGFGAFASHAPDDGRIVVMFGPHIGISDKGNLGKVVRPGMSDESTSCGACVGAFSLRDTPPPDMAMGDEPIGDYQMNVVRQIVAGKASAIEKADEHDFAALNNEFYASVKAELLKVIPDDLQFPIALIGGIQINTDVPHTDFFLPKDVMFRKGPGDEFADLSKDFESLMAPARKDEGKGHLYIQQ